MHEHTEEHGERPRRPDQGLVEDASTPGQPPVSPDVVGTGGEHPSQPPPDRGDGEDPS